MTEATTELPVLLIQPTKGFLKLRLKEIWNYRELLYFLVWRDIKVRYKQTVLGAAWAVLQPIMTMIVFSVVFSRLAKVPSDGIPYPVFAFTALLPWNLFSFALSESSNSLVGSQNLITKVYFPRLVIPMASVIAGLVDFGIAFCVLILMMIYYGIRPTPAIVFLPVFVLFALTTALSVGLWLSALNVKYRDIRYIIPFLTQIWLYATPVAFPASIIPEPWRSLSGLNPMAGVVEGFRWALLGTSHAPGALLWISVAAVVVLLIGGLTYFRRMESTFADIA